MNSITFADFFQVDQSQTLFVKSGNNFFSSNDGVNPGAIPVYFRFNVNNGYGAKGQIIAGTLTFSSTFFGTVTSGLEGLADQELANYSMVFTANTAGADGSTNLLNVSAVSSTFSADGSSGSNQSSTAGGDMISFSSSALDFSGTTNLNFSNAFSSINPSFSGSQAVTNQSIPNFVASGTGLFASNIAPNSTASPEPASLALMAGGLLGSVRFAAVRRRRKNRAV